MTTEPDVAFVREYFACYESEASSLDLALAALMPELDMEDCNCVMNCNFKFSLETRLLLRAGYQRLTPAGRTAFLAAHMRDPSPGQTQWMLPIAGMGLEKVCKAHFINTLQESNDRVREVIRHKRNPALPGNEEDKEMVYIRDKRSRKKDQLERMARGLSYFAGRSRRVIPARKVKAPCNLVCSYKCHERFPLEVRQAMLRDLFQMPLAKQRQFLADHVCKVTPTRRRVKDSGRSTIYYFFEAEGKLHKVCKTMFLNTYDITDRGLRTLIVEKGANTDVICGNPKLAKMAKNPKRFVFDLREGLKGATVANKLEDFPIDIGEVKVEDFEPEMDDTEEEILPDGPPATDEQDSKAQILHSTANCCDDKFVADHCDDSDSLNGSIKMESSGGDLEKPPDFQIATLDIKTEVTEAELEQPDFMVVLPGDGNSIDEKLIKDPANNNDDDDDSATDSQGETPLLEEIQRDSKHVRNKNRRRGHSHTTPGGRTISARTVKPNCGDACLMQCPLRVSEEVRQQLLAKLLEKPKKEQRTFIGDHICAMVAVKVQSFMGRGSFCYHYFLPIDSQLVRVCQTMFINTYDLTHCIVRKIITEKGDNKHVVCGNPYFPSVLKKGPKFYYDYDERCDEAVLDPQDILEEGCKCRLKCESAFPKKVVQQVQRKLEKTPKDQKQNFFAKYVRLVVDKKNPNMNALYRTRFFLPHGYTKVKEVCQNMFQRTFQLTPVQLISLLKKLSKNSERLIEVEDPVELAKEHIVAHRMSEDHRCGGALRKLSRCPNVARMYNKYLARCPPDVEPIGYQQYYVEFGRIFVRTGLQLPTKCPDCGYFDEGGSD